MNAEPSVSAEKAGLRREYKARRASLSTDFKRSQDAAICRSIADSAAFREAATVLLYCPFGDETDVLPLLAYAKRQGKRVAFPRCEGREMTFYYAETTEDFVKSSYGVKEPPTGEAYGGERSVCVVPGLVFDNYGCRIGYGGGYYDRFLAGYGGVTIAPVRDGFLSGKPLPCGRFDVKCDFIADARGVSEVQSERNR